MKKLLGIVVLALFWCSSANSIPSWIGKNPIKICKASQDIELTMNWYNEDGSLEEKPTPISIQKGEYVGYYPRVKGKAKHKKQRWWMTKSGEAFTAKNESWMKSIVGKKYKGVKINKVLKK